MAEFDQIREELRAARVVRDEAAQAMAITRERLKRIDRDAVELARVFNEGSPEHAAHAIRLREERDRAEADAKRQRDLYAAILASETNLVARFAEFTDPRKGIEHLQDSIPILLLPVRLET